MKKQIFSWALYDWANSAFSTTVIAVFFPIFFKDFWSNQSATDTTFWLAISVSTASLIISVLAPILGAFADKGNARKKSLFIFALIGIFSTASLYFVAEGNWQLACFVYIFASVGFFASNVFYDSLIIGISSEKNVDFISSFGYALGYLGGGILLLINILMVQNPENFGLVGKAEAVKISFLLVAIWWLVFSLPLFFFVKEPEANKKITLFQSIKEGFKQVKGTFSKISGLKTVWLFLVAYWFYIDGVDTIVTMAVDYGKNLGFETSDLITAILMVQFAGFPFALLFGWLGQKFSPKPLILIAIFIYLCVTVLATQLDLVPYNFLGFEIKKFFVLAFLIASVQGGIQSLSRSFFARLVPKNEEAEFFGFYNLLGKFAAILGPVLLGTIGKITGSPQLGILSIAILFLIGGFLLSKTKISA